MKLVKKALTSTKKYMLITHIHIEVHKGQSETNNLKWPFFIYHFYNLWIRDCQNLKHDHIFLLQFILHLHTTLITL